MFYFRFVGPLLPFVLFGKTNLYQLFEKGPQGTTINTNYENCNNNGWATLLLLNSHFIMNSQVKNEYYLVYLLKNVHDLYFSATT